MRQPLGRSRPERNRKLQLNVISLGARGAAISSVQTVRDGNNIMSENTVAHAGVAGDNPDRNLAVRI